MNDLSKKRITIWLLCGCFLIFTMVVIGGITRLTGSGLSMTEWNVVIGAIPPLNEQQWQIAFEKYKQIPQFQKINYDYSLSDFKKIFFWEYLHRLVGRLVGIVFIIPFLWFYFSKQLDKAMVRKSLLLFALGALQGFLGWFMVKSGLTERTSVSHYRLAIHLITAFITYGFTLWFALELIYDRVQQASLSDSQRSRLIPKGNSAQAPSGIKGAGSKIISLTKFILVAVVVQIIYGAFTAGLHAGKIANTFPTMDGEWIPSGICAMSPLWKNVFENLLTVQFIHRIIAILIVVLIAVLFFKTRKNHMNSLQKNALTFLIVAVTVQFLLGVFTLIYSVPVALAVVHQVGAFFLFSSVLIVLFQFNGKLVSRF
jgi:cytochrome c oxidase assembly protein subunit 15